MIRPLPSPRAPGLKQVLLFCCQELPAPPLSYRIFLPITSPWSALPLLAGMHQVQGQPFAWGSSVDSHTPQSSLPAGSAVWRAAPELGEPAVIRVGCTLLALAQTDLHVRKACIGVAGSAPLHLPEDRSRRRVRGSPPNQEG